MLSSLRGPWRLQAHSGRAFKRSVSTAAQCKSFPATQAEDIFRHNSQVSSWRSNQAQPLSKSSFLDMLDGKLPAVYEKLFVSREHCKALEEHLQPRLAPYSHIAGPRVDKVGLAQFEFQAQSAGDFKNRGSDAKNRYFSNVDKLGTLHEDIARATGINPWMRVVDTLRALLPEYDLVIAREPDGRQYHAGIYRSIGNSTPIHCDWSPYDSKTEDWIINRVTRQGVFNLYLAPMVNGETIVYERQWTEDVLEHRDPETYGYFPSAVEGRAQATLKPNVGDIYFFNTRQLHEVKAVGWEHNSEMGKWKRPRLTLSAFIGLLPAGEISARPTVILWS